MKEHGERRIRGAFAWKATAQPGGHRVSDGECGLHGKYDALSPTR